MLARKGVLNLAVAAVARKLTVAVWYLLMGRTTPGTELEPRLQIKVTKIIGQIGAERLAQLVPDRRGWRQEIYQRLKTGLGHPPEPKPVGAPASGAAARPTVAA